MNTFETRLLTVARPLLPDIPVLAAGERSRVESDLARSLATQVSAMPRYSGVPFQLGGWVFEWAALLRYGRRHSSLPLARQRRRVLAWSRSPLPPIRDWVKLVRSCALFHYLDHPTVQAHLAAESGVRAK